MNPKTKPAQLHTCTVAFTNTRLFVASYLWGAKRLEMLPLHNQSAFRFIKHVTRTSNVHSRNKVIAGVD